MKEEEPPVESPHTRRTRIRRLGYDPEHLTFAEQRELLEIEAQLSAGPEPPGMVVVS